MMRFFPQISCSICSRLSTCQVFFQVLQYFNYCTSSYCKNSMWIDRWMHARENYRHKCGKIGPPHLFCEHGNLSIFCSFRFKQCLVGNIQRRFPNNSSATFITEESPYTSWVSVSESTSFDLVLFKSGQNLGLIGTCQIKVSAHQ